MYPCKLHKYAFLMILLLFSIFLSACGNSDDQEHVVSKGSSGSGISSTGSRPNTPKVLTPKAAGTTVQTDAYASIDTSSLSEGYFMVKYLGNASKVKLRVKASDNSTNDYNIKNTGNYEVFPLSQGNGSYEIMVCEQLANDKYAIVSSLSADVTLTNEFGPFLYPNQYVNFTADSQSVKKAAELVKGASTDLDAITSVYNFTINNITYDTDKAESVQFDYIPNVDDTLTTKKGICFDYASLMGSMLRSQGIPTKIETGYSGEAVHAWISVYTKEEGWIDDIIQFDGKSWSLMDPTFAASGKNSKKIQKYIGDAKNYTTKHTY